MTYSKINWSTTVPINVLNLDLMDSGIYNAAAAININTADITNLTATVEDNSTNITSLQEADADVSELLTDVLVVRTGSFSGTWVADFTNTLGITVDYNDYSWSLTLYPTSTIASNASLELSGVIATNTMTVNCQVSGAAGTANYSLIGVKKTIANTAIISQ